MPEFTPFRMPSLGADMEKGILVEWLVQPGDKVERGAIVAVVETDKGAIEIEVFHDAEFVELLAEPGTVAPVGMPLATMRVAEGVDIDEAAPAPPPTPSAAPSPTPPSGGPMLASPGARARARELGLDLDGIVGSGPEGAVVLADIDRPKPAAPPAEPPLSAHDAMRRAIGAAMSRSKREIPHYYLGTDIDLDPALAWLAAFNEARSIDDRVLAAALLVKAVALACRKVPELNAHFVDGRGVPSDRVHVGVAVSLRGGGLVAPAIHDVDRMDVGQVMAALSDLVDRAREGRLRRTELADPTITVTSLGQRGVPELTPIITPPQVAIVGFGRVEQRPWVVDGEVVPRQIVHATLAADHRVSDGHRGSLFLRAVERSLARPEKLDRTVEEP